MFCGLKILRGRFWVLLKLFRELKVLLWSAPTHLCPEKYFNSEIKTCFSYQSFKRLDRSVPQLLFPLQNLLHKQTAMLVTSWRIHSQCNNFISIQKLKEWNRKNFIQFLSLCVFVAIFHIFQTLLSSQVSCCKKIYEPIFNKCTIWCSGF